MCEYLAKSPFIDYHDHDAFLEYTYSLKYSFLYEQYSLSSLIRTQINVINACRLTRARKYSKCARRTRFLRIRLHARGLL